MRKWLSKSEECLGNHSDRLNAINIFPVADGDTGTNLYLTIRAASNGAAVAETEDVGEVLELAAQAAMEEARGNSGTLFAVMLSAMAEPLHGSTRLTGPLLAAALHRAQIRSWSALSDPVPGTMLSVLESSAAAAGTAGPADESNATLSDVLNGVVEAARKAVVDTEAQLQALTEAEVVDAGGVGLLLILDTLRAVVLHEDLQEDLLDGLAGYNVQDPHLYADFPDGDGVEVMCTVNLSPLDAAGLRAKLDEMGDSVIMSAVTEVEEGYRWRLHVHTEASEPVLEQIRSLAEPSNVSVTSLSGTPA
ncbi:DAK2 domain-containing protein [Arthrobacter castelli]|uniref:DAK2 domain-containing protein n=1 Tax=Arthrobacter castelli TaxID=271431 RepID=UPI00055FB73F|nr:DAK2 domain-containing protein [Arthrobacter castelli]